MTFSLYIVVYNAALSHSILSSFIFQEFAFLSFLDAKLYESNHRYMFALNSDFKDKMFTKKEFRHEKRKADR